MTPEQVSDLDSALDRFEARVRKHLTRVERRIRRRRARAAFWKPVSLENGVSLSALRPSLDDYDQQD